MQQSTYMYTLVPPLRCTERPVCATALEETCLKHCATSDPCSFQQPRFCWCSDVTPHIRASLELSVRWQSQTAVPCTLPLSVPWQPRRLHVASGMARSIAASRELGA